MNRMIFHIDCNNAFLSWEAAYRLTKGETLDIRTIPAVIGGNREKRKGIVLASSYPAKKFGIRTGMSLMEACKLCPNLDINPPDYDLYVQCSDELMALLSRYTPLVERYSIDECFADVTGCFTGTARDFADMLRNEVSSTLGFTVNIGVSDSKLLAKTASGFSKPDKTHELYSSELEEKYFPLPIHKLFMIGFRTCMKLYNLGYRKIGDVAHEDPKLLRKHFKLFGLLIWSNANGVDHSLVRPYDERPKGIGNGMTLPADAATPDDAYPFILSLCEISSQRLRAAGMQAYTVSLGIRTSDFRFNSHQRKLISPTQSTMEIYGICRMLYNELWDGTPARGLSVRLADLVPGGTIQLDMLGNQEARQQKIDSCIDDIRGKYGDSCLMRASTINTGAEPVAVTTHKKYPKIKPNILNGA
ncbi:MAG TPA: DNA polymerase IV [Clostridia bacterium]|nr:DNA polymerase IV [Clostridia bacterium]HPQ45965.1 DNA polymerase IV [Clostridia bacterium]